MSGIIFFKTNQLSEIRNFYLQELDMQIWLDQGGCLILQKGNLQLGFCQKNEVDRDGIITFYFEEKEEVEKYYSKLKECATCKPIFNKEYNIYQFFARDPEGRTLEFQTFLHPIQPYLTGDELLIKRRSIRRYKEEKVGERVINKIFDLCRFVPTSMNNQSYYYLIVQDKEKKEKLASLNGPNSQPISAAPLAIAICSKASKSEYYRTEAELAAYHLMLAARLYGLGTCWIADMNRNEAKELLNIPDEDYIATITPLGYPAEKSPVPTRRKAKDIYDYI